jgi:hypothetical protein
VALSLQTGQVWWPAEGSLETASCPLENDKSAAFHPVELLSQDTDGTYTVKYGDGHIEAVPLGRVLPYENPVQFGGEEIPVQVLMPPLTRTWAPCWPTPLFVSRHRSSTEGLTQELQSCLLNQQHRRPSLRLFVHVQLCLLLLRQPQEMGAYL